MRQRDRVSRRCAAGLPAVAAFVAVIAGGMAGHSRAFAQEGYPAVRTAPAPTGVIVKFRDTVSARGESQTASVESATADSGAAGTRADTVRRVAARARLELRDARALPLGMHVLELDSQNSAESFDERLARLRADPEIEFAEPDYWRFPLAAPNDLLYANQWYWQNRVDAPSAVDAETAWDTATGSAGVVIAVLDTGVLFDHPDLGRAGAGGRLLPGYDFVTDVNIANDGNGRDSDPSDPGDWVAPGDPILLEPLFSDCLPNNVSRINSSWHGTRVAGLIGARTNNAEGIAGGDWESWLLPVRVLGKCGGRDSDILPGMLWAAGIAVPGMPPNPHPAQVLNMSLGSSASRCPETYRDAVDQIVARGVLVVASAGNDSGPVSAPGNCPGVLAVTGLRQAGTKVGFANVGPEVGISAPGGNCVNVGIGDPCLYSIDTTWNRGTTTPGTHDYTNQINANYGTSFASPIVSAVAGLMLSVNGNLRSEQLIARMRESAKAFPPPPQGIPVCPQLEPTTLQCSCTTTTCGAGMLNAAGAVAEALRPIAAIAAPISVSPGQSVTLSGAGSAAACGYTVTQHAWSVVSAPLGGGGLTSPNTAETQVLAPVLGGEVVVRLTVTDDAGRQDSALIAVRPTSTSTTAPANAGSNACPAAISPIGVVVLPQTASVRVGDSVSFTADVVGAADDSVTWQVNGIAGGNATVGSISSAGVYTAPATVPSPAAVTVTAIAAADPSATGSAVVTVTPPPDPPAPPAPSGGGGGAGLDLLLLALVPAAARVRRRRFRR